MKIIDFFKKLFFKNKQKLITAPPKENIKKDENQNYFLHFIKVEIPNKLEKNRVKTMICDGDGLGISTKIKN